ncbi:MAG TPA: hypothetical protein V6C78_26005 [Crinalium sp.]|jgi:hypothetical protein
MIDLGQWTFRRCDLPRTYEALMEQQQDQIHIYIATTGLHILGYEWQQQIVGIYWFNNSPAATPTVDQGTNSRINLVLVTPTDARATLKGRPEGFANPESWEFSK